MVHSFSIKSDTNIILLVIVVATVSVNECKMTCDCTSDRITENHRNVMRLSIIIILQNLRFY